MLEEVLSKIDPKMYEDYQRAQKHRIRQDIFRALIRHRSLNELMVEFDLYLRDNWKKGLVIVRELQSRSYTNEQDFELLRKFISDILSSYGALSKEQKRRADISLKRITPLLPTTKESKRIGLDLLPHRRKSHRHVGYTILGQVVDQAIVDVLIEGFQRYCDIDALECIARSENKFAISVHAEYILDNLGDHNFLKARIFQRLLHEDSNEAVRLSSKHEVAFVWGVGRARAHWVLDTVIAILTRNYTNYESLGLIVWALGRLGAVEILSKLDSELADEISAPP